VLILTTGLHSQTVIINNNCKNAYSNILSLKFKDAQLLIDKEKKANPKNIFIPYLENYIDFLKVTISEDEELFNILKKKVDERIDEIEILNDTSVYKKYLIGNINLQWATARVKFGEYATAAFEINRAYRLLEANNKEFPGFMPNSITLGVLHIMIGIIPDSYDWILNLISMHGDVIQGQNELKQAYKECEIDEDYIFLKPEVLFYMGMINLSLNPNPEFGKYLLSKIADINNKNLLLTYLAINTNMKTGHNSEALKLFTTIDTTQNYYPFYYLNYLHGECQLRSLNPELAKNQFNIFLTKFNGKNYIKRAWQKTGWAALINGDTTGYYVAMKNVLLNGGTNIDADKNAENTAKSNTIPNIDLLKSTLQFDGGYYKNSTEILTRINLNKLTVYEQIEVSYRFGRIAQRTKNMTDAKKYYRLTIKEGNSSSTYYAANSALLIGNIYELENNFDSASFYYNTCLELDFDQYRNSIRGKAKQGLKRVN